MSRLSLSAVLAIALLSAACDRLRPEAVAPQPIFPELYRSSRAIEAALGVGVIYGDYSALVRHMSEELVLAADRVRFSGTVPDARSKRILENYQRLLELYKDAGRVWSLEVQNRTYADDLPALAKKYGVPEAVSGERYGRYVNFEGIRQAVWLKASRLQEQQTADVFGQYAPPAESK